MNIHPSQKYELDESALRYIFVLLQFHCSGNNEQMFFRADNQHN